MTHHVEACAIPVNSLALSHSTEFVSNGAVIRTILAHIKHGHYVRVMTESIGYIFAGIARLMRRRFDEMSRDTGITSPQWRVLVSVHCNPGINQGTLADMLDVRSEEHPSELQSL